MPIGVKGEQDFASTTKFLDQFTSPGEDFPINIFVAFRRGRCNIEDHCTDISIAKFVPNSTSPTLERLGRGEDMVSTGVRKFFPVKHKYNPTALVDTSSVGPPTPVNHEEAAYSTGSVLSERYLLGSPGTSKSNNISIHKLSSNT